MGGYNFTTISTVIMFPSDEDVDATDIFRAPHLFVKVPWFYRFKSRNFTLVWKYANYGLFHVRLPLRYLSLSEWDLPYVITPRIY